MKKLRQKILLWSMLSVFILAGIGVPVQGKAILQASSAIDAYGMVVEDGDFLYVVGDALDLTGELPAGSLDISGGMQDIWVAKLRRDGTPVFQALIGGTDDDFAFGVAVRQGVIYILGETWSNDFPGASGNAGENDAVVLALAADGKRFLWARRFGGSQQDTVQAIALRDNSLYLTGVTWSQDFVPGAAKGDADGFLARMDLSGKLLWMKVFGGSDLDAPYGLAVGAGTVWVVGETFSPNLAGTPRGDGDIFVLRFDANGAQQFGSLYGGQGEDIAYAAALAPDGSLYLAGDTQTVDLPNARGQFGGDFDSFFMHIGADGSVQSTSYLGGSDLDTAKAVTVLPNGDPVVAGGTYSDPFPTGYTQTTNDKVGEDAFIAHLRPNGELVSILKLGGDGDDEARAIGITTAGVALAGSFTQGDPSYLLLIPAIDLPEVVFPTIAPLVPTATQGATVTRSVTPAAGPTGTPTPLVEVTGSPESTSIGENSPTIPAVSETAPMAVEQTGISPTAAQAGTPVPAPPTAAPYLTAAMPGYLPEPVARVTPPEVWVRAGLITAVVLGASVYWYRRNKKWNQPPGEG